jgi:hypothetical protein
MEKMDKTDRAAEASRQQLPGKAAGADDLPFLATSVATASIRSRAKPGVERIEVSSPTGDIGCNQAPQPVEIVHVKPSVVEQFQELMSTQALRLKETSSDSLSVVLKP